LPAKRAVPPSHIEIRSFKIVLDTEDQFNPELTYESFLRMHGTDPEPPRFRIVSIDAVTCPEDGVPVLVTECGTCPGFIRRMEGKILCRKAFRRTEVT
jgi:hypothetical protein